MTISWGWLLVVGIVAVWIWAKMRDGGTVNASGTTTNNPAIVDDNGEQDGKTGPADDPYGGPTATDHRKRQQDNRPPAGDNGTTPTDTTYVYGGNKRRQDRPTIQELTDAGAGPLGPPPKKKTTTTTPVVYTFGTGNRGAGPSTGPRYVSATPPANPAVKTTTTTTPTFTRGTTGPNQQPLFRSKV